MILDRMDRLGTREQLGIGLAALALFLLVVDFAVVKPLLKRTATVRAAAAQEARRLAYCRAVVGAAPATRAEYEDVRDLVGRAASPDEAAGQMIGEIDEMAARSGVLLARRRSGEPRKFSYCEEHVMEVTEFSAQISQLLAFLYEIQRSPGMLRVTSLKFAPEKGSSVLKGSMEITKIVAPAAPGG